MLAILLLLLAASPNNLPTPPELLISTSFVTILALFLLAGYYLTGNSMDAPLPVTRSTLLLFAIAIVASLLLSASGILSIRHILQDAGTLFASPAWQYFGVALGALVFSPLLIGKLRHGIRTRATADFVAVLAFLLLLLTLYLPFGFDSIGHWEEWVFRAYLEGRPSKTSVELVSRFWLLAPIVAASAVSPLSFAGFHLVNFLMFWGKVVLLYGILRQLKFPLYSAFLISLLYMVYPVTSGLMSLRFFLMNFRIVSLLAAIYLMLDSLGSSARLSLAGIWLALALHVGSYEAGYAIVAIVPIPVVAPSTLVMAQL